jgi:hypothetical protein
LVFNANSGIIQPYHGKNKLIFNEMLMRSAFHKNNTISWIFIVLKQQFVGRYVAPLEHIILIPNQPIFALSPYFCVPIEEATNTNFIVFGLSRSGLETQDLPRLLF